MGVEEKCLYGLLFFYVKQLWQKVYRGGLVQPGSYHTSRLKGKEALKLRSRNA
jgi:hypothetical protein